MQKRKTYFEQVPIEVVEKVRQKATDLAEVARSTGGLFSTPEHEALEESVKQAGKLAPKESR